LCAVLFARDVLDSCGHVCLPCSVRSGYRNAYSEYVVRL
jgi:hypothetical protein